MLCSCRLIPREQVFEDFILVRTENGDTFSSLAEKYLNDPDKGQVIAEFNGIEKIVPDQDLIIPLKPFSKGGLKVRGYQTVPILSYHRLSTTGKADNMIMPVERFESQMMYLQKNGYTVITIEQFMDYINFRNQIPRKSVVITFDDGWKSIYEVAYPILKKFQYPATLFIYTNFIGARKAMSWDQIKELSENGFSIHCHSKSHRYLNRMKKGESFRRYYQALKEELFDAKMMIQEKVGKECKYLAYPYGAYNNLVIAMAEKYGYYGGFTARRGVNPFYRNRYKINRSMIYGEYDLKKFSRRLVVFRERDLR
jgi:peptidoglycan/xylan/chitin deacetylase (PgdA/CDA1 family)